MARLDPTSPTALGAALAVLGSTVLFVGGGTRPGALDMLPGHDGALVGSVLALALLLLHGLSYRVALLAASPVLAATAAGFFIGHPRPLAPVGLQIALYGALGIATAMIRGGAPAPAPAAAPAQLPDSSPRTTDSRIAIDECSRFSA